MLKSHSNFSTDTLSVLNERTEDERPHPTSFEKRIVTQSSPLRCEYKYLLHSRGICSGCHFGREGGFWQRLVQVLSCVTK